MFDKIQKISQLIEGVGTIGKLCSSISTDFDFKNTKGLQDYFSRYLYLWLS